MVRNAIAKLSVNRTRPQAVLADSLRRPVASNFPRRPLSEVGYFRLPENSLMASVDLWGEGFPV